jgi:hypothetical protein
MAAISYIYGFDIPGEPTPWFITTLYYLSWLGTVAEKYEIPGLSETVLKAAHRALGDGSRDEAKLEQFLCYSELLAESTCSSKNPGHFAFAVRILGQHLTAIRTNAAFQKLLQQVPKLSIDLLNLVAEEKDKLEETLQRIAKDLK